MDSKIIGALILMIFIIMVVLIIIMGIMFWYSSNDDNNDDDDDSLHEDLVNNIQNVTGNLDLSKVVVAGKVYQFVGSKRSTVTLPSNSKNGSTVQFNNISSVVQKLKSSKPISSGDVTTKMYSLNPNSSVILKMSSGSWNVENSTTVDSTSD